MLSEWGKALNSLRPEEVSIAELHIQTNWAAIHLLRELSDCSDKVIDNNLPNSSLPEALKAQFCCVSSKDEVMPQSHRKLHYEQRKLYVKKHLNLLKYLQNKELNPELEEMKDGKSSKKNERVMIGKTCPVQVRRSLHRVNTLFLYLRGRVL